MSPRRGHWPSSRSIKRLPRWLEPLSTIQNTLGTAVGLECHDLFYESGERDDAGGVLAALRDLASVHVVGSQVG